MPPAANLVELAFQRLTLAPVAASGSKRRAAGHAGLSSDSSASVRLVALSRLLATKAEMSLEASASTAAGAAFTIALQGVVLRVAVRVGGASPQLDDGNVRGFFNLSASHVAQQHLYNAGWSLPSRLPHAQAKVLLSGLLDALTAIRTTAKGHAVAQRLLQVPVPLYDGQAATEMAELMAALGRTLLTCTSAACTHTDTTAKKAGGQLAWVL